METDSGMIAEVVAQKSHKPRGEDRPLTRPAWLLSRSRWDIFAWPDHVSRQQLLREILRIQCHDEVGPANLSASTERIVPGIGRDVWNSRNGDKLSLFLYEIDTLYRRPDDGRRGGSKRACIQAGFRRSQARQTCPFQSSPGVDWHSDSWERSPGASILLFLLPERTCRQRL